MSRTPGSGRQPGSRNKTTREFRHAVQLAFERIGGVAALSEWAASNPGEFYRICGRLIPGEMAARTGPSQLRVIVDSAYELRAIAPRGEVFESDTAPAPALPRE